MRERVAEVEPAARPTVVRVPDTHRALVRGCAARVERAACKELGLQALGLPVSLLPLGQRGEQCLVDHDARRPVEGTGEVLAFGGVDAGLPADRGVDLADEGRRDGNPGHASEIRRSREAGDVGRGAAAERDDGAVAVERQLVPEPLDDRQLLRLFAGGQLVPETRRSPSAPAARSP